MSDNPSPSPLNVQLTLRRPNDTYWDGVGFSTYPVWLSAAQVYSTSWTYTNFPPTWADRTVYKLFVRAIDRAGNLPTTPDFTTTGHQFRIDYSSPISMVDSLSTSATNYLS